MRPIVSLPSTTDTRNKRILGKSYNIMIFKGFFIRLCQVSVVLDGFFIRLFRVSVVLDGFVLHSIGKRYIPSIINRGR